MPDQQIDNKRLIAKIDKAINELEADISLMSTDSPSAASEAKVFSDQVRTSYADATRRIILGDERGSSDLETLIESISEKRVGLLSTVLSNVTERVRAAVTNPFWFGDQHSFLDQLDGIQKDISKLQSGIDDRAELANSLREQLSKVLHLVKRLERQKRRVQYMIPLRVLLWETPIFIGIVFSGRLSWTQNLLLAGLFLAVAIASFVVIKRLKLEKPIKFSPKSVTRLPRLRLLVVVYLLVIIPVFLYPILPPYIMKRPLHLNIGPLPTPVAQGSDLELPYSIRYASQEMIFDVNLTVDAPGLLPDGFPFYSALSDQEEIGKIHITIPPNIPDGVYPIKVTCSFRGRNKWLGFLPLPGTYAVERTIEVTVKK